MSNALAPFKPAVWHGGYNPTTYVQSSIASDMATPLDVPLQADKAYAMAFYLEKTYTFDQLGFEVTTGAVGSVARVGIYDNNGEAYPGRLLGELGTIALTTGIKLLAVNLTLAPGLYFVVFSINAVGPANVQGGMPVSGQGVSSAGTDQSLRNGYRVNYVDTGALPARFPAGGAPAPTDMDPIIGLRVAKVGEPHRRHYSELMDFQSGHYATGLSGAAAVLDALTLPVNNIWITPLYLDRDYGPDSVSFRVTTGNANKSVEVALYADRGDGFPGALVYSLGTVSVATAGFKTIALKKPLPPGLWWIAIRSFGTGLGSARLGKQMTPPWNPCNVAPDSTQLGIQGGGGYTVAGTTMPARWSSTTNYIGCLYILLVRTGSAAVNAQYHTARLVSPEAFPPLRPAFHGPVTAGTSTQSWLRNVQMFGYSSFKRGASSPSICATLMYLPRPMRFLYAGITVADPSTDGPTTANIGLYRDNGRGLPGRLEADFGSVNITTAGHKHLLLAPGGAGGLRLDAGWWWPAAITDSATATFICLRADPLVYVPYVSSVGGLVEPAGGYRDNVGGAFPDPFSEAIIPPAAAIDTPIAITFHKTTGYDLMGRRFQ